MTREQALKKLRGIYGKKAAFRVTDGAANATEREKAAEAAKEIGVLKRDLTERIEQRKVELLNVPDYQDMLKAREQINKRLNELMGMRLSHKFTVGYISEMGFFHVEGHGDTWEEAFAEVEAKNPRGVTV